MYFSSWRTSKFSTYCVPLLHDFFSYMTSDSANAHPVMGNFSAEKLTPCAALNYCSADWASEMWHVDTKTLHSLYDDVFLTPHFELECLNVATYRLAHDSTTYFFLFCKVKWFFRGGSPTFTTSPSHWRGEWRTTPRSTRGFSGPRSKTNCCGSRRYMERERFTVLVGSEGCVK